MRISQVRIENFRAHQNTIADLDDLTVLIGRNGSGKSSILYALDFFYNVNAVLTGDDVYASADEEVAITVTYSDLSESELNEFGLYVRNDLLAVVKKARRDQPGKYYGIVPQLPEFVEVRSKIGASSQREAYNELRQSGRIPGLHAVRSQQELFQVMDEFERNPANAGLLQLLERQEQFFGDRRAGAGRLDKFTSFMLVPAVREAAAESEKRGAIQILVDRLVTSALANREDIVQFRRKFEEEFRTVYASENLSEINRVSRAVNNLLGRYAPGVALKLQWREAEPPSFGLPAFHTRMGDERYDTPIALQGHGMQRALVLSLLQLMASQGQEVAATAEEGEAVAFAEAAPDLVIAIEEPELYLHPAQCRYLGRLLSQLAAEPGPPRTQVIYATHSPYFVQMSDFERIRVVRRSSLEPDGIPCCTIGSIAFGAVKAEIERVAQIEPARITRESFVARCASVMDVVANEGFFASVAVVVEGYGEVGCLRAVERHLGLQWDERGIVIVPARSKNNIDRPVYVFRGLGIPCYFMFDGDNSRLGTKQEGDAVRANRLLMRLAGAEPQDFPDTQVHPDWAVLGDCLESELESSFESKVDWEKAADSVREELGFGSVSQALKNPDGMAAMVNRIYALGKRLPVLEAIADQVTALLMMVD